MILKSLHWRERFQGPIIKIRYRKSFSFSWWERWGRRWSRRRSRTLIGRWRNRFLGCHFDIVRVKIFRKLNEFVDEFLSAHFLDNILKKLLVRFQFDDTGWTYYKTESLSRRFITWMDMHENPIIKHSISLRKSVRVFANPSKTSK